MANAWLPESRGWVHGSLRHYSKQPIPVSLTRGYCQCVVAFNAALDTLWVVAVYAREYPELGCSSLRLEKLQL